MTLVSDICSKFALEVRLQGAFLFVQLFGSKPYHSILVAGGSH